MAFLNAQQSRVLLGPLSLSASLRSAGISITHDTTPTTTLADTSNQSILTLETSTFSFDGPLDVVGTANLPYDILSDNWKSAEQAITHAPFGLSFGTPVILSAALETDFTTTTTLTGSVDWSATGQ